jgi:hypothetical protein
MLTRFAEIFRAAFVFEDIWSPHRWHVDKHVETFESQTGGFGWNIDPLLTGVLLPK